MEEKIVSLTSQLKRDFMREGQKLTEFMEELKTLSAQDKADYQRIYRECGICVSI